MKLRNPRPYPTDSDQLFWVVVSRLWSNWKDVLHMMIEVNHLQLSLVRQYQPAPTEVDDTFIK